MIEYNKRVPQWEITCDNCASSFLEVDGNLEFGEVVKKMLGEGWTTRKLRSAFGNDEWYHTCSDCS